MVGRTMEKKKLGNTNYYINDLFDTPDVFLDLLVEERYLIPGDPDNSKLFRLMSFDGPMYKVFTNEEIKLWRDYTHIHK